MLQQCRECVQCTGSVSRPEWVARRPRAGGSGREVCRGRSHAHLHAGWLTHGLTHGGRGGRGREREKEGGGHKQQRPLGWGEQVFLSALSLSARGREGVGGPSDHRSLGHPFLTFAPGGVGGEGEGQASPPALEWHPPRPRPRRRPPRERQLRRRKSRRNWPLAKI